jgi:hypothetical protein
VVIYSADLNLVYIFCGGVKERKQSEIIHANGTVKFSMKIIETE